MHQSLANLEINFLFCIDHYSYHVNELNQGHLFEYSELTIIDSNEQTSVANGETEGSTEC